MEGERRLRWDILTECRLRPRRLRRFLQGNDVHGQAAVEGQQARTHQLAHRMRCWANRRPLLADAAVSPTDQYLVEWGAQGAPLPIAEAHPTLPRKRGREIVVLVG